MNELQEKIEHLLGSGWSQQALADEMGMSWNGLRYWRVGERYPHNAKAVLALLDSLADKKPPPRRRYPEGHYMRRRMQGESNL
jgi:hypothetical protein